MQTTTNQSCQRRLTTYFRKLALVLSCAGTLPTFAQSGFPRNESFMGQTSLDFTLSGTAELTGTGANGKDKAGEGYLRLTPAETHKAGSAIDNIGFTSKEGFSISFEFFSYGKTSELGADGFSVFLVDASKQPGAGFLVGASGGSLGYAQKTDIPGATGGYIGIGIDEYGNYSNATEGRFGGLTNPDNKNLIPNAVAIRGAGNGAGTDQYPYLTGTGLNGLKFKLDVQTPRAQPGTPDYRRAFIDVVPRGTESSGEYRITVRVQHGNEITTAIRDFRVAAPPEKLRLGFSGSTGGSTNIHEIRNLNIVRAPFANDDALVQSYNQTLAFDILANDEAPGAELARATVSFDTNNPSPTEPLQTLEVPDKGTFNVDETGRVTFEPVVGFVGLVTVPYVVFNNLNEVSSPANIVVNVRGADIRTELLSSVENPKQNEKVLYTVTTAYLSSISSGEVATDVVPTLKLAQKLPADQVLLSSGSSYDPATGIVTFPTIPLLTSSTTSVKNTVTVTMTELGNWANVAESWSAVPDPDRQNNVALRNSHVIDVLPVTLTQFQAALAGTDALLTWTTATEINNKHFEVERSIDGKTFQAIKTVAGQGSKATTTAYSLRDTEVHQLGSSSLHYRLRQVDTDGKATYGPVRTVQLKSIAAVALALYPNPTDGSTYLDLRGLPADSYTITIADIVGRSVLSQQVMGGQRCVLLTANLKAGSYIVQLRGPSHQTTLRLVRR